MDVVIGPNNTHLDSLRSFCARTPQLNPHFQVTNMAMLMFHADLMIGAGGSTTWERCCMGLPSLVLSISKHQSDIAKAVDKQGALSYLGSATKTSPEEIAMALKELMDKPLSRVKAMSTRAKSLVDGFGTQRVVGELVGKC